MKKLSTAAVVLLGVFTFSAQANSVITAENLEEYHASFPDIRNLEQQAESELNDWRPEAHCNWQQHYQAMQAAERAPGFVTQFEQIIKQHGFKSGAEYTELSAKISLPWIEQVITMYQQQTQANASRSAEMQQAFNEELELLQETHNIVAGCLSSADKAALKQYQQKITDIMTTIIMLDEDDDQEDAAGEYY